MKQTFKSIWLIIAIALIPCFCDWRISLDRKTIESKKIPGFVSEEFRTLRSLWGSDSRYYDTLVDITSTNSWAIEQSVC